MSSSAHDSPLHRTIKAKKAANSAGQPPVGSPGTSQPTAFFLRSEKDLEQMRGRLTHRASEAKADIVIAQDEPQASSSMASTTAFGVESLQDTINSALFPDGASLSRTNSNRSGASADPGAEGLPRLGSRKRKANPVHPRIAATGQRIISGDYSPHATRTGSPTSLRSMDSPMRSHLRRGSTSSSINVATDSQPLTPLRLSPAPASAMPSTPRSGSPKSFRLSDEEVSVASDCHSQAMQSSNGEEEDEVEGEATTADGSMPQLVMPSLAMPSRRPFTERGRRLGRMKIMVVGAKGAGKTSLIHSLCRVCEDIVHVDPRSRPAHARMGEDCQEIWETCASTRAYPTWWTDFQSRRQLLRRTSVGEGVLERNVTFVDTPGFQDGVQVRQIERHFKESLARMGHLEKLSDSELIAMLSGEGGVQIDAVIWVFDARQEKQEIDAEEAVLLQYMCKWTNVVPIISFAEHVDACQLAQRRKQVLSTFRDLTAEPYLKHDLITLIDEVDPQEPFAISSAPSDDSETIDASVLMASDYLPPLIPSQLDSLASHLFDADTAARFRHISATKFLLWRQENMGAHLNLYSDARLLIASPHLEAGDEGISVLSEEPGTSNILVPHGSSSYFRSTSSDSEAGAGAVVAANSYSRVLDNASPSEPFRQVRLAKWAQDLQRSLNKERRKYQRMYSPTGFSGEDYEKAITATTGTRPPKGRLGGPLSIIDPRDPLGVLALSQTLRRRGFVALQVAGGFGLVGAVMWWVVRNWGEVVEFFGGNAGGHMVTVHAIPAPSAVQRGGWGDVAGWREWAGLLQ